MRVFTSVRGSKHQMVSSRRPLYLELNGDDEVTIKGFAVHYSWVRSEISDSPNSLADDLMNQATKDLRDVISGETKSDLVADGSQASVVAFDLTHYPTWSKWNKFGECDESSCTHTRRMRCAPETKTGIPDKGSQIPCADPNPDNAPTETRICTSDKCRKFAG